MKSLARKVDPGSPENQNYFYVETSVLPHSTSAPHFTILSWHWKKRLGCNSLELMGSETSVSKIPSVNSKFRLHLSSLPFRLPLAFRCASIGPSGFFCRGLPTSTITFHQTSSLSAILLCRASSVRLFAWRLQPELALAREGQLKSSPAQQRLLSKHDHTLMLQKNIRCEMH